MDVRVPLFGSAVLFVVFLFLQVRLVVVCVCGSSLPWFFERWCVIFGVVRAYVAFLLFPIEGGVFFRVGVFRSHSSSGSPARRDDASDGGASR